MSNINLCRFTNQVAVRFKKMTGCQPESNLLLAVSIAKHPLGNPSSRKTFLRMTVAPNEHDHYLRRLRFDGLVETLYHQDKANVRYRPVSSRF